MAVVRGVLVGVAVGCEFWNGVAVVRGVLVGVAVGCEFWNGVAVVRGVLVSVGAPVGRAVGMRV